MHRKPLIHRPALPQTRYTALAVGLLYGLTPAARADTPAQNTLKEVTVHATRTERRLDNVPSTVTVVTQQEGEARGARDIKGLLSDELDVEVPQGPSRYSIMGGNNNRSGNESINIRGLQGNQVLMMVDGIRVPSSFSFGGFTAGRGDYLDINGLQKAEILRGPATTQYGSDGLGGAVFFHTLEPSDLLQDGQAFGGFVKSGYNSVDRSWLNAAGIASQNNGWQSLLQISYRSGHELANRGDNTAQNSSRTTPNPSDTSSSNVLAKLARQIDSANRLGLTVESLRSRQQTEVYSARGVPPYSAPFNNTLDLQADDRVERDRVSLKHSYSDADNPLWQKLDTQLYWQRAKVVQLSADTLSSQVSRTRDNAYLSNTFGISSQAQSALPGPLKQQLSYGFDWSRSLVQGLANGTVPSADTFPSKAFPDTTYTQGGAFVQDEIELGTLSLIPGLRYDQYRLTPSNSNYNGSVASLSGQAWSPRFGVVWRLMPQLAPYAQWGRGFRAPTPEQVNLNYSSSGGRGLSYRSISNPNLKPERSNSIEVGLRGKLDRLRYSLAYYDNRYQDMISQEIISGDGKSPANPQIYQYINLKDARIRGWEARTEWLLDEHWRVKGGVATARGNYLNNGVSQPLKTIQPLKAVLTLGYDSGRWGANATIQHAEGRNADDLTVQQGTKKVSQYATPAWTTLDLGAFWKPRKALTVNAGINNLFNRKYWRWSDVQGLASTDPAVDGWTAPGRNAYINVRYDF